MNLKYHCKRRGKSWDFSLKGGRVTFGCWMNIVRDEVIERIKSKDVVGGERLAYQYRQLEDSKDIRLLELAPGSVNDPLRGSLVHNPIVLSKDCEYMSGWSMPYEAVSYCWGSAWNNWSRLLMDDGSYLKILPSLEVALRHLRSPKYPRALWIDAVCINQTDIEERNSQVQQMLDVYARAEKVNIWLGPAKKESTMGMQVLRYLANSSLDEPAPWSRVPEPSFLVGLREVLGRDWFRRIWVVQEAAVSQKAVVMCGEDSFSWTNDPVQVWKFMRRIKYASISLQWEQAGLHEVNMGRFLQVLNLQMQHIQRQINEILTPPLDILDVAFETRHRHATDRRDKLFAIMGLADRSNGSLLQLDYSMNVEMVFQQLLEAIEI